METYPTRAILNDCFETDPKVYMFGADQTKDERTATLKLLSPEALIAAEFAMEHILADVLNDGTLDHELQYYMATEDEDIGVDGELRMYSSDWRLQVLETDQGTLYDFNGWPGDNEDGVGVFISKLYMGVVFVNVDQSLTTDLQNCDKIIAAYGEVRNMPPEDFSHAFMELTARG